MKDEIVNNPVFLWRKIVAVKFIVIFMKEHEIFCFKNYWCKYQASTGYSTIPVHSTFRMFDHITEPATLRYDTIRFNSV